MADRPRKVVIRPYRPNTAVDARKAQTIWEALSVAIDEIYNHNASKLSFEELYRNAYNLVLHKHGALLYEGVRQNIERHLLAAVEEAAQASEDQLLRVLNEKWMDHKIIVTMIRDILMYMDRTFVVQNKKVPVYDMGLGLFRDIIVRNVHVKDRLRKMLLLNVERERMGQIIDRDLMKSVLSMLMDLGVQSSAVYEEDFEVYFLRETARFYNVEAQDCIEKNTCPEYLKKVERRLNEEQQRVTHYLESITERKLKFIVEKELVEKHAKTLVEMEGSGCIPMFLDDKVEDLGRMYQIFIRVGSTLEFLQRCMYKVIKDTGEELLRKQEETRDPVSFVQGVLDLRDKYANLVRVSFHEDKAFHKVMKESFESFLNTDSRSASYLALYVDNFFRNQQKLINEADMDNQLSKVIVIFRYLQDKDIFENFYKQHLAKRLLSFRSISHETERSMIGKLKTECGYQFTSKLEGMFNDIKLSKDTMDIFRKQHGKAIDGVELQVNVLTTGCWPIGRAPICELPIAVTNCSDTFKAFYLGKHTGRRLTWHANMGTAELRARFAERKHDLIVSTYQMCILLLFNERSALAFTTIANLTQIPASELRRHLISLCTPKARILNKSSKGKTIQDEDVFEVNEAFKSKLHRVRVPLVSQKEKMEGEGNGLDPTSRGSDVPAQVEDDRRHQIEAAIVRIMKTRRNMEHNLLVAETTRQLASRFVPSPQLIKKRIESLIEREYLERTQKDRRVYHYLA